MLIGEVGLSGELRWVGQMTARLREAAKLGFKTAIVPRRLRKGEPWPEGIQISRSPLPARSSAAGAAGREKIIILHLADVPHVLASTWSVRISENVKIFEI